MNLDLVWSTNYDVKSYYHSTTVRKKQNLLLYIMTTVKDKTATEMIIILNSQFLHCQNTQCILVVFLINWSRIPRPLTR